MLNETWCCSQNHCILNEVGIYVAEHQTLAPKNSPSFANG